MFENLEYVEVPVKFIGELLFKDYEKSFFRDAINSINEIETYNFVYLTINREADKNIELKSVFGDALNEDVSPFDRITKFDDVSHIEVKYKDKYANKDFRFSVPWIYNNDNECSNEAQDSNINKKNDLELIIVTKESLADNKDLLASLRDEFEDIPKIDMLWDLYS